MLVSISLILFLSPSTLHQLTHQSIPLHYTSLTNPSYPSLLSTPPIYPSLNPTHTNIHTHIHIGTLPPDQAFLLLKTQDVSVDGTGGSVLEYVHHRMCACV